MNVRKPLDIETETCKNTATFKLERDWAPRSLRWQKLELKMSTASRSRPQLVGWCEGCECGKRMRHGKVPGGLWKWSTLFARGCLWVLVAAFQSKWLIFSFSESESTMLRWRLLYDKGKLAACCIQIKVMSSFLHPCPSYNPKHCNFRPLKDRK